ncbi:hypothetical protein SASPL_157815 [Salvia splendens]|uniref:Kinesin motor domain-containing protein n=1 Tax=Salvia splendens TaxID=180675 RepID=A0A8X8YTN7_SALSN|nr:hypothetical protein SASPL_157815 [Salvia splendens]
MSAVRCVLTKFRPPPPLLLSWCRSSTSSLHISPHTSKDTLSSFTDANLIELINSCSRQGNIRLGSHLHAYLIKNPPSFDVGAPLTRRNTQLIYNCLLHMYCKCGQLSDAVHLFDEMPLRDTVSWNSLISGFLKVGNLETGFGYFKLLLGSTEYMFDHASLTSVLSACGGKELLAIVKRLHALAILSGYHRDVTVGNALTTSYFRCLSLELGMCVFYEMAERNVVSWTAAISGMAQNEYYAGSLNLFVEMYHSSISPNGLTYLAALTACSGLLALKEGAQIHGVVCKMGYQSNLCIESALMDVYSKCGCVEEAWRIFESAEVLDEVSMTVILAGFAQNGYGEEAIRLFVKMVKAGAYLDPNMISAILGVFGIGASQGLGMQIHSMVTKKGSASNVFVSNGLINMYSKCGELEGSVKVFEGMVKKNQVSWNSMIAAFARHGDGLRALELYEQMKLAGVEPTDVTFLSLLHACSHVGFLHKGMELLQSMEMTYGMRPRVEHYACVVDMLGRAGMFREAKSFIEGLRVKPDALVWQALLGSCSIHGNVDVGNYAAEQLAQAAPDSPVLFVSMANIYSSRGLWKERARTIKKMNEIGVAKDTGASWIEVNKKIHSFVVADRIHQQGDDIYAVLTLLFRHMRDDGLSTTDLNCSSSIAHFPYYWMIELWKPFVRVLISVLLYPLVMLINRLRHHRNIQDVKVIAIQWIRVFLLMILRKHVHRLFRFFAKLKVLATDYREEHARLSNEVKSITIDSLLGSEAFTALENLSVEHELLKNKYHEECDLLKKKYLQECSERKKLYNEVIELKGNIRVFCRCRPLKQDETEKGSTSVVDFDSSQENELQMICSDSSKKQFKFDYVFRPEDNQDNRGVNYRTLEELFRISKERSCVMRYELFVSMLEVYNEKIRDLLVENPNQPAKKLDIKQSAEGTQEVPGLVEARVYDTDGVWSLLKSGSQVRSVGSTNANEFSSRSHCLLRVTVAGENIINGQRTRSHLWLVDLAGSERVGRIEVEGERLKESQFINKSLAALGDVISALASKSSHVPYRHGTISLHNCVFSIIPKLLPDQFISWANRNSKLTHMLQSSLGGDCKTLMFVQISPNSADLGETLCSLNFASRVRGAEKAKQDEKEAKKLQDNVQALQLRLAAREHICKNLQDKVRDLETQLAEERKTRIKQENRALASLATHPTLTSNQAEKSSTADNKKPPLGPSLRLPLRRLTNLMPPTPANKKSMMPYLPAVREDRENVSRENKGKQVLKARRGSLAVRPPPATTTGQVFQPKRRSSIATFRPESNSSMATPLPKSSSRMMRNERAMGRQSFVWDPQRVWRTSRVSSPLPQSREAIEATPIGPRSSKFRGSPPSQVPGSWKPKHPTVVALQKKVVWSPLKLRGMKNKRNSMMT